MRRFKAEQAASYPRSYRGRPSRASPSADRSAPGALQTGGGLRSPKVIELAPSTGIISRRRKQTTKAVNHHSDTDALFLPSPVERRENKALRSDTAQAGPGYQSHKEKADKRSLCPWSPSSPLALHLPPCFPLSFSAGREQAGPDRALPGGAGCYLKTSPIRARGMA